jgi:hypothetical protein
VQWKKQTLQSNWKKGQTSRELKLNKIKKPQKTIIIKRERTNTHQLKKLLEKQNQSATKSARKRKDSGKLSKLLMHHHDLTCASKILSHCR